jgi:hypothetical protein
MASIFGASNGIASSHLVLVEQILFLDEEKLSLWIDEPLNEPGASNAVHFDIFP